MANCGILIITKQPKGYLTMMQFDKIHSTAFDIVQAWEAQNSAEEVHIIQNNNDAYELWLGYELSGDYSSFDDAKRNAEAMVPFTVNFGD